MSRIGNSLFQMQILLVDAKKRNAPDVIVQAFEDSVEALEQKPCEDCISRADVLALAEKGTLVSNGNYKSVSKAINELPSVTPTRPTGHWIDIGDEGLVFKCSLCGLKKTIESHYCPNCGAKMEGMA